MRGIRLKNLNLGFECTAASVIAPHLRRYAILFTNIRRCHAFSQWTAENHRRMLIEKKSSDVLPGTFMAAFCSL